MKLQEVALHTCSVCLENEYILYKNLVINFVARVFKFLVLSICKCKYDSFFLSQYR